MLENFKGRNYTKTENFNSVALTGFLKCVSKCIYKKKVMRETDKKKNY